MTRADATEEENAKLGITNNMVPLICSILRIRKNFPLYGSIREARYSDGSASLCRVERKNKMAATYNVLAFKR